MHRVLLVKLELKALQIYIDLSNEENNMIEDIFAKFGSALTKNIIRAYKSDFAQYQNWCMQSNL